MNPSIEESPSNEESPSTEESPPIEESPSTEESRSFEESPAVEESPSLEKSPSLEGSPSNDESLSMEDSSSLEKSPSNEASATAEDNDESDVSDNEDFLLKDQYDPYNYTINKSDQINTELSSITLNLASSVQKKVDNLEKGTFDDCKICKNCKDKRKYGGPGKLKKACIEKPKASHVTRKVSSQNKEVEEFDKKTKRGPGRPKNKEGKRY